MILRQDELSGYPDIQSNSRALPLGRLPRERFSPRVETCRSRGAKSECDAARIVGREEALLRERGLTKNPRSPSRTPIDLARCEIPRQFLGGRGAENILS
jgi:hypothetical protein